MTALVTKEDIEGACFYALIPRISTFGSYYSGDGTWKTLLDVKMQRRAKIRHVSMRQLAAHVS